jgi:hypothetical protein
MRKSMRPSVAAAVYMLNFLSSQGIALSQEHSRVVDTGVIFSGQQVERSPNVAWLKNMGITPPFWTPSLESVGRAEGQLKPYAESVGEKKFAESLGEYKRQYVGYTDRHGMRRILVSGICERYWREEEVTLRERVNLVLDGGPCFFTVHYDVSISKFDDLFINGP